MFRLTLVGLTALLTPMALSTPAYANHTGDYQKKVVSVVEADGSGFSRSLRAGLEGLGRFVYVPAAASASTSKDTILAQVAAAARAAGMSGATPAYVFIPTYEFTPIQLTPVKTEEKWDKGVLDGSAFAVLQSSLVCTVNMYELPAGRLVKQLRYTDELDRRFEYRYDQNTSTQAIQYKANELATTITREYTRPPAQAFATQAESAARAFGSRFTNEVRNMPEFQLAAGITGWSSERDRIFFNLGRELNVQMDDSFKVMQGNRVVGFLKARKVDQNSSEAQPIFYDSDKLNVGDRVVEYPKSNAWQGLKVGGGYMNGPLYSVGYGGQFDIGPWWGASEFYGTADVGMVSDGKASGVLAGLGLVKKSFNRRWGFSYGAKANVMQLSTVTGASAVPGVSLVTGLDCYLTPDFIWTNDLDLQAFWPVAFRTGANAGKTTVPFGPVARTGITFVF